MIKFLYFIRLYPSMGSRIAILACALLSLLGIMISFYTQYVIKLNPCLSCYILRYSYLTILVLSMISLKFNRFIFVVMALSILIVCISSWGILGYAGYISNPCIESCPLGGDVAIEYMLFILAFIGGIVELILSYLATRFSNSF